MRYEGLDFPDTVRSLAKEVGVEVPEAGGAASGRVIQIYRVNDAASRHFRSSLRSHTGAPARRYLEERGIPSDLEERFQIGFAPAGWEDLVRRLERDGESLDVALQAGLIAERQSGDGHYDRFRERLVFPIAEPSGRVVGFGGRALGDGEPKYLNSPETPVYRKGRALFGLAQAVDAIRAAKRVIVVEGYFDRDGPAPRRTARGRRCAVRDRADARTTRGACAATRDDVVVALRWRRPLANARPSARCR